MKGRQAGGDAGGPGQPPIADEVPAAALVERPAVLAWDATQMSQEFSQTAGDTCQQMRCSIWECRGSAALRWSARALPDTVSHRHK